MIHISLRSSGSVISRMMEKLKQEKLQKMDWVKIPYGKKKTMRPWFGADGHLAERIILMGNRKGETMYENLLKLIQQAETADRIGKIENVVGMSMEASEADPVLVILL